jgi:SOS response regulatory protein OraA/RecX
MGAYYKTHNITDPAIQQALFSMRLRALKEHWPDDKMVEEAGKIVQKLTPQHIYGAGASATSKPAEIARRLVIRGFFSEIIGKIGSEEIEERLMNRIDDQLAKVGA